MARFAIVHGGQVANLAEASSEFAQSQGWIPVAETVAIGDLWDGSVFSKPPPSPPSVPQSVTRRQARQALLIAGKLALVQPAIDGIPDPVQRGLMQIEFDDSQVFERHRPSLVAMASALGMSSADLDNLFTLAATL